jgi:quercetin dioxygenase-like cupin family protein
MRFGATAVIGAALLLGGCQQRAADAPAGNTAGEANAAPAASISEAPLARAASDPALQWGACPAPFPAGCELTILHGDPAKPNADALLRVPAGYAIPPHAHSSAERMVLVSGRMTVKYRGHPEAELKTGNYAYGPAKMPHRAACAADGPCTLFIAFEGPVDVLPVEGSID